MSVRLSVILLCCVGLTSLAGSPENTETVTAKTADVLETLRKNHPRLVLTDARLAELKKLAADDDLLAKAVGDVLAAAEAMTRKPPCRYELRCPRLLHVSRDAVDRSYALGLAFRWTDEKKYARALRANLLAVCSFKDWNPSHFLDTAEMSHAVAIGYDWIYPELSEADRKAIRSGLIELGLKPGLACYGLIDHPEVQRAWWVNSAYNWNQVCNMGLSIGALGIAETDPQYARQIIPAAVASLPRALAMYDPDGAWAEGPSYWGYATRYTVYGLAAMQTALGRDFGLSDRKGLSRAGFFPLQGSGPTGLYFNFADAGLGSRRGNLPSLFWLARRYDQPALARAEREMIRKRPARAADVIWYVPAADKPQPLPANQFFDGPVQTAFFRSKWSDPNALYLAIKAGYNQVNHGQLDLGTFVLDALGKRWFTDLGKDNYNLPGYWDGRRPEGKRWNYYRMRTVSHNVPVLDGQDQDVFAKTKFQAVDTEADQPWAILDLTDAYDPKASKVLRGVKVLPGRRVLIQDEFELSGQAELTWGLTTEAKIDLQGRDAVLTIGGRKLTARILAPAEAEWAVRSAEQKEPDAANKGFRRLHITRQVRRGRLRVAVVLVPHWPDRDPQLQAELDELEDWNTNKP